MSRMNRLMIRLWDVLEGEDPSSINYQIAKILIENSTSIAHTSSSALADLCHVSKPSISRFCKHLGYDDYYDFRAELNQIIPDQGSKYWFFKETEGSLWMTQYLEGIQESVEKLKAVEVQEGVEALAKDIRNFPKVYLMGNMQSGKTAEALHYNLHVVKRNIQAVTNFTDRIKVLSEHSENTLFVFFSVSGNYFRALFPGGKFPEQASSSKIWMVTANPSVRSLDGVDRILNLGTWKGELYSGNICLEIVADSIALYYWKHCRN